MSRVRIPSIAHSCINIDFISVSRNLVTHLQAIILGLVQGLTEFLPVSSSGHLQLFQFFFGFEHIKNYIFFDLICHLGTLLAVCIVLFDDIKKALFQDRKILIRILIALLPLFPLLLIMNEIKSLFESPFLLGFTYLFTSGLLFLSLMSKKSVKPSLKGSFVVGIFQAIAILPGLSRSGSTIAAARLIGWSLQDAIRFSFLLAIPTILGGIFIESLSLIHKGQNIWIGSMGISHYFLGFFVSFIMGFFALKFLIRLGLKGMVYFAWYCLIVSIFCLIYFI